ncbi:MAG: 30S ribosomal protein S17 [Patescibacteria group bacterium]
MKTLNGKVISDKMAHAVVVEVGRFFAHPIYHKRVRRTHKLHALNKVGAKLGDMVKMVEIRPISRTIQWKVEEIL